MLVVVIEGAVCVLAAGWMASVWRSVHRDAAGTVDPLPAADGPAAVADDRMRFGVAMDAHGNASGPL